VTEPTWVNSDIAKMAREMSDQAQAIVDDEPFADDRRSALHEAAGHLHLAFAALNGMPLAPINGRVNLYLSVQEGSAMTKKPTAYEKEWQGFPDAVERHEEVPVVPETLWSSDGKNKVADVAVPPWQTPVELYVWGSRFFIRREIVDITPALADRPMFVTRTWRYCEAQGSFWIPGEALWSLGPLLCVDTRDVVLIRQATRTTKA
jgi:hypothetical protein